MRAPATALLLAAVLFAAGCGGDDKPPKPKGEEAAVIAAVDEANKALRNGDYEKLCTYYTVELVVQLIKDTKTKNCKSAWKAVGDSLKATESVEVRDALAGYSPESAVIKGNTATAKFGPPPEKLKKLLPSKKKITMVLFKVKGRWIIASPPAVS